MPISSVLIMSRLSRKNKAWGAERGLRIPAARPAGIFRRRAKDDWRHCRLARQGSMGDGCSVRDLGCIVSVRKSYARSQAYEGEPKRAHTRRALSPLPCLRLTFLSYSLFLSPCAAHRLGRVALRRGDSSEFSAVADVTRVTSAALRIDRAA